MSNNAAVSNVIPMREFDRSTPTQEAVNFEKLLRECQQLALERLSESLSQMLSNIEQAVWTASSSASDREARDQFALAKQVVVKQRALLQEQFHTHFLGEFEAATAGKRSANTYAQDDLSALELSLVDENDFEETLRVNEMSLKLRRYCDEEVVALDQRVGVLLGDATLQGKANPFSPQAICNAFRRACQHVESDVKIRLTLLKMFDDHVLDDIRSIYKDLNTLLVQHAILPKIRYGSVRRAAALGALSALGPKAEIPEALQAELNAAVAPSGGDQDFFALLQGLMGNVRPGPVVPGPMVPGPMIPGAIMPGTGIPGSGVSGSVVPGAVVPGTVVPGAVVPGSGLPAPAGPAPQIPGFPPITGVPAGGQPLDPAELVQSLTRIQHGDVSGIGGGSMPLAATLIAPGMTNVLRELKATPLGSGMGQTEGTTLEIVIMLFDQIFDDRKIPSAMKGLIGRLQIPTLKVALIDKTFFSKKTHPARQLLDALGDIALQLPQDFGSSSPLYAQLDGLVQKLIDSFQDDMEVFDAMRAEVERLGSEDVRRAEEQARELAQAVEQKEKLALAKAVAQHAIKLRVDSRKLPPVIVRFLSQQWVKLLLVTYAKHGADSDAYKTATATMDLLIWSVSPMQSLAERRRLATRLPGLLKRLNFGMQLIDVDDATRRTFFAKLMRCHTRIINGNAAPATAQEAPATDVAPHAPSHAAPAVADESTQDTASDQAHDEHDVPVLTDVAIAALEEVVPEAVPEAAPATGEAPPVAEQDQDMEPTEAEATFSAVTIPNPFGDGEIEVEEIDLAEFSRGVVVGVATDIPGMTGGNERNQGSDDEHARMVGSLKEGAWLEFRDDDDNRTPARLSYISPLKGTYLFVNRQGRKVAEYSLYQLTREFRTGRAALIDSAPLVDRAMTSLVGVLKMGKKPS
ncbi:MAG: DUF1631 domain-containing protein [Burkholderiales bacterium]|nr:DUF1631 domain-containing protein [Burkholderiales bacterium]